MEWRAWAYLGLPRRHLDGKVRVFALEDLEQLLGGRCAAHVDALDRVGDEGTADQGKDVCGAVACRDDQGGVGGRRGAVGNERKHGVDSKRGLGHVVCLKEELGHFLSTKRRVSDRFRREHRVWQVDLQAGEHVVEDLFERRAVCEQPLFKRGPRGHSRDRGWREPSDLELRWLALPCLAPMHDRIKDERGQLFRGVAGAELPRARVDDDGGAFGRGSCWRQAVGCFFVSLCACKVHGNGVVSSAWRRGCCSLSEAPDQAMSFWPPKDPPFANDPAIRAHAKQIWKGIVADIVEPKRRDPWQRHEAWRYHPYFGPKNVLRKMFPGLGIATAAFAAYLWLEHVGIVE